MEGLGFLDILDTLGVKVLQLLVLDTMDSRMYFPYVWLHNKRKIIGLTISIFF
jgi:hypothetical protein